MPKTKTTTDALRNRLRKAIRDLHGCKSRWVAVSDVRETFKGELVWSGPVHTFALVRHPSAKTCYAWATPVEGSDRFRYYAVLSVPPIDSPEQAIRAAIISDGREGRI